MEVTLDTWIISDTHFNHANIVKYCRRPENHTEIIAQNWMDLVHLDDDILHLGDMFMGPSIAAQQLLANLPGNKYFIRGNHDHKPPPWYREVGFTFADSNKDPLGSISWTSPENKRVLFSHYPNVDDLASWNINIHGHIHNNGYNPATPMRDYRNVSIEVMDYKPVRLRDILYNGAYESREDAPEWELQTRHEGEHKP